MRDDLISRNELLKMLQYNKKLHKENEKQLIMVDIDKVIEYVEQMPTAFNVEKVIKELNKDWFKAEMKCDEDGYKYKSVKVILLDKTIEIIRKGGTDE